MEKLQELRCVIKHSSRNASFRFFSAVTPTTPPYSIHPQCITGHYAVLLMRSNVPRTWLLSLRSPEGLLTRRADGTWLNSATSELHNICRGSSLWKPSPGLLPAFLNSVSATFLVTPDCALVSGSLACKLHKLHLGCARDTVNCLTAFSPYCFALGGHLLQH